MTFEAYFKKTTKEAGIDVWNLGLEEYNEIKQSIRRVYDVLDRGTCVCDAETGEVLHKFTGTIKYDEDKMGEWIAKNGYIVDEFDEFSRIFYVK